MSFRFRKLNTSPSSIEDTAVLKKLLTTPPVKKIDLHFPLGLEVTARNLKGVTIKDALDAIHKQFKKKVCNFMSSRPPSGLTVLIYRLRLVAFVDQLLHYRQTMSSRTPSLLVSSGTRRSRGRGSWYIRRKKVRQATRVRRARRIRAT